MKKLPNLNEMTISDNRTDFWVVKVQLKIFDNINLFINIKFFIKMKLRETKILQKFKD